MDIYSTKTTNCQNDKTVKRRNANLSPLNYFLRARNQYDNIIMYMPCNRFLGLASVMCLR